MLRTLDSIQGFRVSARGKHVGNLVDAYFDDGEWRVRYFVAETGETSSRRGLWFSPAVSAEPDDAREELPITLTGDQLDQTSIANADREDQDPAWASLHDDHGWPQYWLAPILGAEDGPVAYTDPAGPPPAGASADRVDAHLRSANEIRGYAIEGRDGTAGRVRGFVCEDEDWAIRYLVGAETPGGGAELYIASSRVEQVDHIESIVRVDMSLDEIYETAGKAPRQDD